MMYVVVGVVGLIILAVPIVLALLFFRSARLTGTVIEKNIAKDGNSDSFVTIETSSGERIVLQFETRDFVCSMQVEDSFRGNAKELDRAVELNSPITIETFDKTGRTRHVNRFLMADNSSSFSPKCRC